MSWDDERSAVEQRFSASWGDTTPVRYENVKWVEPTDGEWVALSIQGAGANQISLNVSALVRFDGLISVQVFAKENTGTRVIRNLAEQAASIFRRADFSKDSSGRIVCQIPWIKAVGTKNGWYQVNVIVPYHRDALYGKAP